MQCVEHHPELVVAFQHQHDPVALADADGAQVVGSLSGTAGKFGKGKASGVAVLVNIKQSGLIGFFLRQRIQHIKGKVEIVRIVERHIRKHTF